MNEKITSLSKSASLTNYSSKKGSKSHLDNKHLKTIDKINQMRYIQYKKQQSACYPYPKLSQTTKMIIQDLHNTKLMKESINTYNQISSITCFNHSKIRSKASRRVFNLFLKEEMWKYEPVNQLKNIFLQKKELTENKQYNYPRSINLKTNQSNANSITNNHLLIKKIIETRLRLKKTMNTQSNTLIVQVNDDAINYHPPHQKQLSKTIQSFRSKTDYNKPKKQYYDSNRKINLSSNIVLSNDKHNNSTNNIIQSLPFKDSSVNKDKLTTVQDIRLKDLKVFFSSFKYFNSKV